MIAAGREVGGATPPPTLSPNENCANGEDLYRQFMRALADNASERIDEFRRVREEEAMRGDVEYPLSRAIDFDKFTVAVGGREVRFSRDALHFSASSQFRAVDTDRGLSEGQWYTLQVRAQNEREFRLLEPSVYSTAYVITLFDAQGERVAETDGYREDGVSYLVFPLFSEPGIQLQSALRAVTGSEITMCELPRIEVSGLP